MSESSKKRAIKIQMRKDAELAERRSELRKEYVSKLASWEISEKTRTELLVDTARCEIEDEQVLAAMRVLDRRGIAWKR